MTAHSQATEHPLTGAARAQAASASARAGVQIRPLTHDDTRPAADLLASIWGTPTVEPPMMTALEHSGAYVVGAFEGPRLVGVCVAYFAEPLGTALHSHVAGVAPEVQGRGIGMAIKQHQRAWCLEREITEVTWTFDPLVAKNAAFNIVHLRADVDEYLVDFYGEMTDGVNAGQGSDRLMVRWRLDRDHPPAATEASATVEVPADVSALRASAPHEAAAWRARVRDALAPKLDDGWRVTGFLDHHYLLEPPA